jgi:O-antigen/teichoic acid export membrane protein
MSAHCTEAPAAGSPYRESLTPVDDETEQPAGPGGRTGVGSFEEAAAVAKGSALLFTSRVVGNAGFLVAVLVLAHALTVSHRGQFAFLTTAAQVISRIAGFGIWDATTVFAAQQPERRSRLLTNSLLFAGVSSTVLAGAFWGVLSLVHETGPFGDRSELLLLVAGAIVSSLVAAVSAFLTGCGRWRAQSLLSAASPWFYALLLASTWAGTILSVRRALVIWVMVYAVWGVVAVLFAAVKEAPLARPDPVLLARTLRFGIRAWIGSVTLLLNYRTDQILMRFIASQAALGVYVIAVNASEILLILPDAAATALLPVLARSLAGSHGERTLRAFRVLGVASLAGTLVAGIAGPTLLPLVFGESYRAAVVPFLWLIAGTIGFVASEVFTKALLAASAPALASLPPFVSLVVGIGLDLALIPPLGATGAAVAASAAFGAGGLTAFFSYRRTVPFSYRLLVPVRSDLVLTWSMAKHLGRQVAAALPVGSRSSA